MNASPSAWQLIVQSFKYHWRMNAAVALGVLAGTAVLTGALLVGDSMRGSLEHLALERLGQVDEALVVTDRFFRAKLADEIAERIAKDAPTAKVWPVMLLNGSVTNPDKGARASQVSLLGANEDVWKAIDPKVSKHFTRGPAVDEVVVNESLYWELRPPNARFEAVVRLPVPSDVPRDSPLGKKTETVASRRLYVTQVLHEEGLGVFALRTNQQVPKNAYLNLATLQDATKQKDKVNALLVTNTGPQLMSHDTLQKSLRPTLEDYGLFVKASPRGYFSLGSERMMLDPPAVHAALTKMPEDVSRQMQPVMTYLANTIACGEREVPYSTIAALDLALKAGAGPFKSSEGDAIALLADDEIALNDWAASDLQAKVGDEIRLDYFEPESTHGAVRETSKTFRLKAIVALAGPADDPDLTPELKGVTDQLSIGDWNPPFPFDNNRVRKKDEDYWDKHRATPKAFVSLAAGQRMWGSRFGNTTTIRIPKTVGLSEKELATQWANAIDARAMGFEFRPVKQQGLEASRGTTPFSVLFLSFSFFIIGAALMLVALLFRLGIDRRAREIGVLLALGFQPKQVRRMLLVEGFLVAAIGGAVGIAVGVGYAWLMLAGLRTWWLAAVTTPFLQLYITPASLAIGYVSGVLTSLLAIAWSLRAMRHIAVRQLLAGQAESPPTLARVGTRRSTWIAIVSLAMAGAISVAGGWLQGEAQAGAFFGAGALVLTAALAFVWSWLRTGGGGSLVTAGGNPLARLALRNGARHPGRSTLTIGLVASAVFLIVAISAFHLDPPDAAERPDTGTGGFALVAESDQPLYQDLDTEDGRFDLGFSDKEDKLLAQTKIIPFRVQPGDDASCLNLYQSEQPRVLGVTRAMIERGGFAFGSTDAKSSEERANPWLLLDKEYVGAVPVFLDAATATYSLHLSGVGAKLELPDGRGGKVSCFVAGLLKNSIFQGAVLMGEKNFLHEFPDVSGYRYFLVGRRDLQSKIANQKPQFDTPAIESALEKTLGDYGFDAQRTTERLAGFLAVQNTYLSTFQSLGGLGLLLGTFGLAVVQLRNVLERRGELALLQAAGFSRRLLARMVMLENASLLVGGLMVGGIAALVAIAPHLVGGGAAIPWLSLAGTLGLVLAVGLLAGLIAVRAVLASPLLEALRGE